MVIPADATIPASGGESTHQVHNNSDQRMMFKVKISNTDDYRVHPVYGFVDASGTTDLHIFRRVSSSWRVVRGCLGLGWGRSPLAYCNKGNKGWVLAWVAVQSGPQPHHQHEVGERKVHYGRVASQEQWAGQGSS